MGLRPLPLLLICGAATFSATMILFADAPPPLWVAIAGGIVAAIVWSDACESYTRRRVGPMMITQNTIVVIGPEERAKLAELTARAAARSLR